MKASGTVTTIIIRIGKEAAAPILSKAAGTIPRNITSAIAARITVPVRKKAK